MIFWNTGKFKVLLNQVVKKQAHITASMSKQISQQQQLNKWLGNLILELNAASWRTNIDQDNSLFYLVPHIAHIHLRKTHKLQCDVVCKGSLESAAFSPHCTKVSALITCSGVWIYNLLKSRSVTPELILVKQQVEMISCHQTSPQWFIHYKW